MGLFNRMRKLQELDLSHNDIISLSSIRIPPFVWNLDLSYNKIQELPRLGVISINIEFTETFEIFDKTIQILVQNLSFGER